VGDVLRHGVLPVELTKLDVPYLALLSLVDDVTIEHLCDLLVKFDLISDLRQEVQALTVDLNMGEIKQGRVVVTNHQAFIALLVLEEVPQVLFGRGGFEVLAQCLDAGEVLGDHNLENRSEYQT